ncbi:MAG: hypothetical protein EPN93_06730 [Spirochaetes bacterium]|nr:MAG: hypothetical protein EPN93_06730 [Spirochaetota bacterium]
MGEEILKFLQKVLDTGLYIGLGALVAWIFYHVKNRDLLGGYIGALVVGVIGALIGGILLDRLTPYVKIFLQILIGERGPHSVNLIAGFIGGFIALFVMNRLNHNKARKKY